ncbi:MAG: hypothetical protein WBB73_06870 [Candidatus Aminicenantaceae bacterium]|jgi:hypothetical protein
MAKWRVALSITILFLAWTSPASAQSQTGLIQDLRIKTTVGFEYFNRAIAWDASEETTKLKSSIFTFRPALEFNQRFSLAGIIGYSLSNPGTVVCRELPLSLELVEGNTGGMLLGGELAAMLVETGDIEIGLRGEYVYYNGKQESFEIPGLALNGTANTQPKWQRIYGGLQFTYIRYAYVYPYLRFAYDYLWGRLVVEEQIQDLTGSQEKTFKSRGRFNAVAGLDYEPADGWTLKAELSIIPNSSSVDWGVRAGLSYAF